MCQSVHCCLTDWNILMKWIFMCPDSHLLTLWVDICGFEWNTYLMDFGSEVHISVMNHLETVLLCVGVLAFINMLRCWTCLHVIPVKHYSMCLLANSTSGKSWQDDCRLLISFYDLHDEMTWIKMFYTHFPHNVPDHNLSKLTKVHSNVKPIKCFQL